MYKIFKKYEIGVSEDSIVILDDGREAIIKAEHKVPVCEVVATNVKPSEARALIREAGYPLHKGDAVYIQEIENSSQKYVMDDKTYLAHATLED